MSFLQAEKKRQTEWKLDTNHLSQNAKKPGLFARKLRLFCLPVEHAHENLFEPIRARILEYFQQHRITWHASALPGRPSNHLCGSQVFTANLLGPFMRAPKALTTLLRPALPDIESILPIESLGQYLAFEWIPPLDLLNETRSTGAFRNRKRGIGCTSIDFAILVRSRNEQTVMVLGEVKYTERYPKPSATPALMSKRLVPYLKLLRGTPWSLSTDWAVLAPLAVEPMYQIFRHHVLACQLMSHYPDKLDMVRLLHFYVDTSRTNPTTGFRSPALRKHNGAEILRTSPVPFHEISVNELLGQFPVNRFSNLASWRLYMHERYQL